MTGQEALVKIRKGKPRLSVCSINCSLCYLLLLFRLSLKVELPTETYRTMQVPFPSSRYLAPEAGQLARLHPRTQKYSPEEFKVVL